MSFEHMQLLIKSFGKWIRVIVVYRPPPSATNKLTTSLFLSEFITLLENLSITSGELLILGDFNLHVDKPSDPDASQFFNLLYAFGLTQHVRESTHTHGHTLDLAMHTLEMIPKSMILVYIKQVKILVFLYCFHQNCHGIKLYGLLKIHYH